MRRRFHTSTKIAIASWDASWRGYANDMLMGNRIQYVGNSYSYAFNKVRQRQHRLIVEHLGQVRVPSVPADSSSVTSVSLWILLVRILYWYAYPSASWLGCFRYVLVWYWIVRDVLVRYLGTCTRRGSWFFLSSVTSVSL